MHWEILQLDRETATVRDVRSAYARLAKSCRPDRDPEGFRQLHEAYETALAELTHREHTQTSLLTTGTVREEAVDGTPRVDDFPPETAIGKAISNLEISIFNEEKDLSMLLVEAERALFDHPAKADLWGREMSRLLAKHAAVEGLLPSDEALVFEMHHDSCSGVLAAIEMMDSQGIISRMEGLASVMLTQTSSFARHSGALVALRLACALAAWSRGDRDDLVDLAYPYIGAHREVYLRAHDRSKELGRVLDRVPDDFRRFWRDRLQNPGMPTDWKSPESREALRMLTSKKANDWPGRLVLCGLVPFKLDLKYPFWTAKPKSGKVRKVGRIGVRPMLLLIFVAVKFVEPLIPMHDDGTDHHFNYKPISDEELIRGLKEAHEKRSLAASKKNADGINSPEEARPIYGSPDGESRSNFAEEPKSSQDGDGGTTQIQDRPRLRSVVEPAKNTGGTDLPGAAPRIGGIPDQSAKPAGQ